MFASVPTRANVTRAMLEVSVNSERASVEMKLMFTCVTDMALVLTLISAIVPVDGLASNVNFHSASLRMQPMRAFAMDMDHVPRSINANARQVGVVHNVQNGCS